MTGTHSDKVVANIQQSTTVKIQIKRKGYNAYSVNISQKEAGLLLTELNTKGKFIKIGVEILKKREIDSIFFY